MGSERENAVESTGYGDAGVSRKRMPGIRVLIVDDDPDITAFIKRRLAREARHFSIETVESARECLEFIRDNRVDCILSDYQMPGMNGMELLEALRGQGDKTPFIFVTGQGNEEIASQAFKNGANDYFTKEVGFAHFPRIVNSVKQAVRQRKAREAEARYQAAVLEYSRKLEALTTAARLVNADLDTDMVLRRLVSAAIDIVSGTSGTAGLYRDGKMVFREYNRGGEVSAIDYSFDPGFGVPGLVMDTMSPYITNDTENDPNVVSEIQRELGFISLVDVPIVNRDGKLIGCFEIHDKKGDSGFDERDVELLQGLAASTAVALENAKLIQAVETSVDEWENTFNAISDPVTILDKDFIIVKANSATAEFLGMDIKDIIGKKCFELFHNQDTTIASCPAVEVVDGKATVRTHEVQVKNATLEVSVYAISGEDGLCGFVHVAKDITERKLAYETISRSKRIMDAMLQAAQFGIVVVGKDKVIRSANRAAARMMGYDSDAELIGTMCYDNICTAGRDSCPVIDLGQVVDHSIRTMLDKYGRPRKIVKSVTPTTLEGEEVLIESFMELKGDLGCLKAG